MSQELLELRRVVMDSRGAADVPVSVARNLGMESAHGRGQWMPCDDGDVIIFRLANGLPAPASLLLAAIDAVLLEIQHARN